MMITDLSEDLVEEILSRVPATSLKRLRSTCKQWNVLFKDERFAKKHFAKAAKQFEVLMLKENRVYSMSVNLHEIQNNIVAAPCIDFKGLESIYISNVVFHCDGLLLCTTNDYMLVVWNPFLGETRLIQPKTVDEIYAWFALGYQNTSYSCRSYKILKYRDHYDPNSQIVRVFEIFELSSDSWRVLGDVNPEGIIQSWTGVSLKGNTYWLAYKVLDDIVLDDRALLSFDFSTERFGPLSLPFLESIADTTALSVVREEKLVLLHQSFVSLELDIWVSTNIDDETTALSWSKFLAVDLDTHNCHFRHDVNFFIDEEKKVAVCIGKRDKEDNNIGKIVCIIGEDGIYREVPFEESTNKSTTMPFVFTYVPSLVHIPQG